MAYIVEDGTIVTDANGYASLDFIRAYALDRGVALSADDTVLTPLAFKAMDYLLQYDARWKGVQTSPGVQALAWPRTDVYFGDVLWASDAMPKALLQAQAALCVEQSNGVDIMPTTTTEREKFVIEDTTGPLTTKWSEAVALATQSTPTLRGVDTLLSALLINGNTLTRAYRV